MGRGQRGSTAGRRAAFGLLLALSSPAQAAGDPVQTWLRGVLDRIGRGQVEQALTAFDERLRTADWRARLAALNGLKVTQLAPELGGAGRYALYYRVPQGPLSLVGGATLSVQSGRGGYRIVAWVRREEPLLSAVPSVLAPGTALALRGQGFPAKAPVELRLGLPGAAPVLLGRVQASAGGSFSLSVRVPADFAQAPPDAQSLQLSADGPGGPMISLGLPFRSPSAPDNLNARYQGVGFSLRYTSTYRSLGAPTNLTLIAPSGQAALRVTLLERPSNAGPSDTLEDAAQFAALYPDLLPGPTSAPTPLSAAARGPSGWTLPLPAGRVAAVLTEPQTGTRWAVLVAEPGFSSLLAPLARGLAFEPPPRAQPLDGP